MTIGEDVLGTCLDCDTPILESQHLLTYESEDTVVVLATCPSCRKITRAG